MFDHFEETEASRSGGGRHVGSVCQLVTPVESEFGIIDVDSCYVNGRIHVLRREHVHVLRLNVANHPAAASRSYITDLPP